MSSTLADLQRLNIKKMEDAEVPAEATINAVPIPSNEVSIIPSKRQANDDINDKSIKALNDAMSEVSSEAVILPSIMPLQKQGTRQASKPKPKKLAGNALSPNAPSSASSEAVRTALEAQIRAHLMEQLMPQNGKGPVTRLNVEMPEDLHQQLKQHCVRTRTPIKGLINALIAWYLEAEGEA